MWAFGNGDGDGGSASVESLTSSSGAGGGGRGGGAAAAAAAASTSQSTSPISFSGYSIEGVFEGGDFSFYPDRRKVRGSCRGINAACMPTYQ